MTIDELKQEFINRIGRRLQLANTADDVYKLARAYGEIVGQDWREQTFSLLTENNNFGGLCKSSVNENETKL